MRGVFADQQEGSDDGGGSGMRCCWKESRDGSLAWLAFAPDGDGEATIEAFIDLAACGRAVRVAPI